ncbi:hypothetical protein E3N88_25272 [Mikania micrantha]|uniref:PX domain-containing protein n=1 Tax=Mikania micrantha TaxID=192012 RepID=A0A5N6N4I7_9ASTR|nr:hypothetical protein E3N88_25272 [Mikania micrantha]
MKLETKRWWRRQLNWKNGRDTIWPHDPHTGWSYCITIPTWVVLPKSKDSDPIVFYRVVVGLQSPAGVTTTRAVLRRFNDFLRLLAALCKAFPRKNLAPAPPKGLLRLKSRTLLEERRCSLEEWMTKLLSDIDISRSIVVASFLELESAARSSFQDENPQIVQGNCILGNNNDYMASGNTPITPVNGSDTAYEVSEIGTPSLGRDNISEAGTEDLSLDEDLTGSLEKLLKHGMSNIDEGLLLGNAILEQVEGYPRHHTINSREINVNSGGDRSSNGGGNHVTVKQHSKLFGNPMELPYGTSLLPDTEFSSSLADDDLITSSDITLVLPLAQQQKMNMILISMQRRLGIAKTDMEDVISRLNQEIAVKDYLMTKVKDLEEELETTKVQSKENLHQAILMETERVTQMQWDMDELRRKSLEMEFKLKSQQDVERDTELPKACVIEEKDKLLQELDDTKNKFDQLTKKHQELEVKSKGDIKVLVREVKSLRNSQAGLKQQLNQALLEMSDAEKLLQEEKQKFEEEEIARLKLFHELVVLHHRLQECNMNLANEGEDKLVIDSPSMQDALKLVKTFDDQMEALSQDDASMAAGDMNDLRKILSDIFVDVINLRRQLSLVTRRALTTGIITAKDTLEQPWENKFDG